MMKYFSIVYVVCLFTFNVFSQEKSITHRVEKGESINQIAQKYKVTPFDIYQLNPDAQSGLKPNSVLLIPKSSGKQLANVSPKVVLPTKTTATKTHEVAAKETLFGIEKKYGVSDEALKKANPNLEKDGLQIGQTLVIPSNNEVKNIVSAKVVSQPKTTTLLTHEVAAKETLFGIEKKYGVTDEALKKANPNLEKDGLQIGQTLIIPSNKIVKNNVSIFDKVVYHEVLPKETKYSIVKQYGITIQELEKNNPEVVSNLPVGYKLIIKGNPETSAPKLESKKEIVKANPIKASTTANYMNYEVKPKETLYSLSRTFAISKEEMIALNPALANGVVEGMVLKVPESASIAIPQETKKEYAKLVSKKSNHRKTVALLLPFNISKIEGDTINSTAMRLKKDKFLNMTLDFYSGALMAIDSAKQIGLPIDVKIFDSQETKNTSKIASIIQENNLENADALIGPFYQSNIEKAADLLGKNQVPVISPLSKDIGNPYANIYQTIPTVTTVRNAMFDYMRAKGGTIIAVVDKKKESIRQYIQENQKDVQIAALAENGSLSAENLKSLFVKDKMNYVIMETGNTGMIKSTIAVLLSSMATYKVQLVILEPNDTLDTDEISLANLVKLKLMYPSTTRENESPKALIFEKEYKKKNKIYPNAYATRGFDITFDTMMRLSQDKNYQETADSIVTEQIDNKFEYYKKVDGGYTNKGVYILYYDTDLTIKEVK